MNKAPKMASLDDTANQQAAMYINLQRYNLTDGLTNSTDYFLVDTIGGISYYAPNDEDWGCVIAVDEVNKLAVNTGFFETDDFEDITIRGEVHESDYRIVCHNCKLMCKFSAE